MSYKRSFTWLHWLVVNIVIQKVFTFVISVRKFFVGFRIYTSDTAEFMDAELIYTNSDTTNSMPEIMSIPIADKVARYVWVYIPGDLGRLHMREFSVYAGMWHALCTAV